MNLVVVYLSKVREHIIIPEKYIHGFNDKFLQALKNYGRNPCRDQLVYWSDECVEGVHYPEPIKNAAVSEKWPAGNGAWYHGRTIWFTDDIDESKKIKENRRTVLPGVYNPARLNERPLPLLVLATNNESDNDNSDEESLESDPLEASSNSIRSEVSTEWNPSQNSTNSSVLNVSQATIGLNESSNLDNAEDQTEQHSNGIDSGSETTIATDLSPGLSNSNFMDENTLAHTLNATTTLQPLKLEPVFAQLAEENAQAVDNVLNSSYEICDETGEVLVYTKNTMPKPFAERNPYEVKQNDMISGNMAFATNEGGDRAYIVTRGSEWKQLSLTNRVVKGLKYFNMGGFRDSVMYDLKFIKVLLVACNGIANVQSGLLDPFTIDFIKDLFVIRIGSRNGNFDALLKSACDELGVRFK